MQFLFYSVKTCNRLFLDNKGRLNEAHLSHKLVHELGLQGFLIIIIKPGSGVGSAKGPDPRFHGSTRVNLDQPEKIKIKLKF
jgi:hypothetical protein